MEPVGKRRPEVISFPMEIMAGERPALAKELPTDSVYW